MKKGLAIALGTVVSLVLLVYLAIQIAGNSRKIDELIYSVAEENVDAALGYADLRAAAFARFPRISLTLDSLSLSVPKAEPGDTVAAFDRLYLEFNPWSLLRGRIKLNEISVGGLKADIERVLALLPESEGDDSTAALSLPAVIIDRLEADASVRLEPGLDIPLALSAAMQLHFMGDSSFFKIDSLDASLAHMPLRASGELMMYTDSLRVAASASVTDCPVDTMLRKYADCIIAEAADVTTDASLSLDLTVDGVYSDTVFPSVQACMRIPSSVISYRPEALDLRLLADIDASLEPSGRLLASVHEFEASMPGLDLKLDGSADDLLSADPCYRLVADANARLEELPDFIPHMIGADVAEGDVRFELDAHTHHSELMSYRFDQADIKGLVESGRLHVSMPEDSLSARLFGSSLLIDSNKQGLELDVDADSLYFNYGESIAARVRHISNSGSITKVQKDTVMLPRLQLDSEGESIFVKAGSGRYGVRAAEIGLVAQRMAPRAPRQRRPVQQLEADKDFQLADIDISLDSSLVKYLRGWSTTGHLKADAGFFASPALPLRTRVTALHADFDDRDITIDTLGVVSGTSDLGLSGYVRGVKRSLMRKGRIESRLKAESGRLNVNEIVAALSLGEKDDEEVAPEDEYDESFVTDTLADASLEIERMPLIVVPGNLDIELSLEADTVNFMEPRIGPFSTGIKVKDRIVQLTSTDIDTDFGGIYLDAFYSTRSKSDISTGVNLKLSDMEAEKVVQLVPSVDSLVPMLKSFHGKVACDISATTQLDSNMNIVVPSLDGLLRIRGEDMTLDNNLNLGKIANLILFRRKDELKIDNMQVDALVHDNKLEVFPFEFGIDRFKLALRGTQSFDKSMYYHLSVMRSPLLIRVGVNVYGTLDNWRLSLGRAKYREGRLPVYSEQLDNVQINLAKSISNIYQSGVEDVMNFNETAIRGLEKDGLDEMLPHDQEFSASETAEYMAMVDRMELDEQLAEEEDDIMAEVEAALEASFVDTDKLLRQYNDSIYDKRMMRKIERLERQTERKAARQARKHS